MKEEEFMENLVGVAKTKLQMFNSLEEECNHLWEEISNYRCEWDIYRNEVICLRSITKDDLIKGFDKWFLPAASGNKKARRKLVVQVIGSGDGPSSVNRPVVETEHVASYIDEKIQEVYKEAGCKTWGKILS
mmetsp:Transcript_8221/g.12707  ORF Transcript_8221/g.12707 Transcript_8221/m.12707 type:complete len:132 (+) Transcript_8221:1245-1640(+)